MVTPTNGNGTLRIVIIDDNVQSCMLLSRFFSLEDDLDIVGTAYSGQDGLGMVQELQPDIVLTDFNLPDLDGQAVTAAIRRDQPHTPVVVMSADYETWVAEMVHQAGASAFVEKSGDPDLIISAIRQTIGLT